MNTWAHIQASIPSTSSSQPLSKHFKPNSGPATSSIFPWSRLCATRTAETMKGHSQWSATRESALDLVPVADPVLTQTPAEEHLAALKTRREVDDTMLNILQLASQALEESHALREVLVYLLQIVARREDIAVFPVAVLAGPRLKPLHFTDGLLPAVIDLAQVFEHGRERWNQGVRFVDRKMPHG